MVFSLAGLSSVRPKLMARTGGDLSVGRAVRFRQSRGSWLLFLFVPSFRRFPRLERNPHAAETMARQGCDVVDHGWRWLDYHGIDEATEREHIRLSVETIRRVTGTQADG